MCNFLFFVAYYYLIGYNVLERGDAMIIHYSSRYQKDYKKLVKKHMIDEINNIEKIKNVIVSSNNLHELFLNPYSKIYGFSQKHGNLKEIITARVNSKIRLWMMPIGEYPYDYISIVEIEMIEIDESHYGEG